MHNKNQPQNLPINEFSSYSTMISINPVESVDNLTSQILNSVNCTHDPEVLTNTQNNCFYSNRGEFREPIVAEDRDLKSQLPLEKLKNLTEQEINKINCERHNIEAVHSNLDLLLKRYNLDKSYLGQMANWFGSKPWWAKILLFILCGSIGTGIGFLCQMPITIALMSAGIYICFAFFFINHYNVTQNQVKNLCEDIIELEKSLSTSIKHFNDVSKSLREILTNMHKFNMQTLENMQDLQSNVKTLSWELKKYQQIIYELEAAKTSIINTTSKVKQTLTNGDKIYKECGFAIQYQALGIDTIAQNLTKNNLALVNDSKEIKKTIAKYQDISDKLSKIVTYIEKNMPISEQAIIKPIPKRAVKTPLQENSADCEHSFTLELLKKAQQSREKTQEVLNKAAIFMRPASKITDNKL